MTSLQLDLVFQQSQEAIVQLNYFSHLFAAMCNKARQRSNEEKQCLRHPP